MIRLTELLLVLFVAFSLLYCKSEEELKQKESLNISFAVTELSARVDESLVRVYPNPFMNSVRIAIHTSSPSDITVLITDETGKYRKFIHENQSNVEVIVDSQKLKQECI